MRKGYLYLALVLAILGIAVIVFLVFQTRWPLYPKPAVYPGAVLVSKYQTKPSPGIRITSFETLASSEEVLNYYNELLPKDGWKLEEAGTNHLKFEYIKGGADSPAFGLVITVSPSVPGKTAVSLEQSISGPFVWPDGDW